MPPMYIGGSGPGPSLWGQPIFGNPISTGPIGRKPPRAGGGQPPQGSPISVSPTGGSPASSGGGILGAQSVRPNGPSSGFDPQYLQNLTTAIGGLFSRPGGNLSFNPLGNLSDISSPGLGFGNAPLPGLPSTLLQDAINGLAFMFNQPTGTLSTTRPLGFGGGGRGGGGDNGNGGRRTQ